LTSLAESKLQQRAEVLSLGAWRRRPELVSRVQSILAPKNAPRPWATRLLASTIVCGLLVISAELARSPQLIAFVPSQSGSVAQADARLFAEANAEHSLNATGMRLSTDELGSGKPAPFLTNTKADLSTVQPPTRTPARASLAANRPGRSAEVSSPVTQAQVSPPAASAQARENAHHEVLAKAELPGSAETAAGEQWIILTAWQEVRLPKRAQAGGVPLESADFESELQSDGETQANGIPADVVVIEQLFLKVVPVVYRPAPATKAQIRAGWLVLQL
jgi:hypothetical protein